MKFNNPVKLVADCISYVISNAIPVRKNLVLFTGTSISTYNESAKYCD